MNLRNSQNTKDMPLQTPAFPLWRPGDSRHLVVTDSDEHDEEGHIIEDAETRIKMVQKRLLKKLPLIREEIGPPFLYGNSQPEIVIVGWGSTFGVMKEAVDVLSGSKNIAMLHFSEIYPFPLPEKFDYLKILNGSKLMSVSRTMPQDSLRALSVRRQDTNSRHGLINMTGDLLL